MTVTPYFLSAAIQSDSIFRGRQKKKKTKGRKKDGCLSFLEKGAKNQEEDAAAVKDLLYTIGLGGGHVAARGGKKKQQKYKKTHTCVVSLSHTRLHSSPAVKSLL